MSTLMACPSCGSHVPGSDLAPGGQGCPGCFWTATEALSAPSALSAQPERSMWPKLDPAARYGLAGRIVDALEPHTEADPANLLATVLVYAGNAIGASPHFRVGAVRHPARLYVVIVGESGRSRKGQGEHEAAQFFEPAAPDWFAGRRQSGLASGEGLIAAVRDPDEDGDDGAPDKRLQVREPEFGRVLKVAVREGNTLSAVIRDLWDTGNVRVMTRKDPMVATGAHCSIVAHITVAELRRLLTETDTLNGFANRFLFVCVRRAQLLPFGGNLEESTVRDLAAELRRALIAARKIGEVRRTPAADERWTDLYYQIAENDPGGLLGAATARADAITMRLALTYALLDGSNTIDVDHLNAAWAMWTYAEDSAAYLFGDTLGDEVADRLLDALRNAGPAGLSHTAQRDVFGRHVPAKRLAVARELLLTNRLAIEDQADTGGRPLTITRIAQ